MKKILIASIFLSFGVAGGASAQSSPTFAQQMQSQNQAQTPGQAPAITQQPPAQTGSVASNMVAPPQGSQAQLGPSQLGQSQVSQSGMMAPTSGPGIYQNAPTGQAGNPLLASPSQNQATSQVPQQSSLGGMPQQQPMQAVVQNGQVVQVPVQGAQGQGMQGGALPPGAAMALPPDSAPIPLPQMPSPSEQKQYFEQSLFKNTAMTPGQIQELIRALDARRKALSESPVTAPRPVTGTVRVSLNPGATPPLIRPYYGEVTSFVVVDSTGQPWPVENFRVGNSGLFSVNRLDGPQGSTFTIDALDNYGQSNLVLKLAGLASPIIIDLVAGQKEQDARVEVRVDRRGPNAAAQGGAQLPPGTSSALLPVLDGVTPDGGKPLTIAGDDRTRGWLMPDGTIVIRTPIKIISPASNSFVSSADGTNVYVFRQTPVLSGMYNNQFISLSITKGL